MANSIIIATGRFTCPLTATQITATSVTGQTIMFISDDCAAAANGNLGNQMIGIGGADVDDTNFWPMRVNDTLTIDAVRGSTLDISDFFALSSDAAQVLTWFVFG